MEIQFTDILPYLVSAITGAAGWFGGQKKQKNDFLRDLQESINLLSDENKKLMQEVISLRKENIDLRGEVAELNLKLQNVKIITRKA
jgi:predicted RNase H-like nuclease (RuvC/YqgF family)